jgi:hypothetical protein
VGGGGLRGCDLVLGEGGILLWMTVRGEKYPILVFSISAVSILYCGLGTIMCCISC